MGLMATSRFRHAVYNYTMPRLGGITPRTYQQSDTSLRIDQNNVDIDVEMGTLAVNTMEYNVLVRMITDYYQKITMVIRSR